MSIRPTLLEYWRHQQKLLGAIDKVVEAYDDSILDQRALRKAALELDNQLRSEIGFPADLTDSEEGYPAPWADSCMGDKRAAADALHDLVVALAEISDGRRWDGITARKELEQAATSYRSAIAALERLSGIRSYLYETARSLVELHVAFDEVAEVKRSPAGDDGQDYHFSRLKRAAAQPGKLVFIHYSCGLFAENAAAHNPVQFIAVKRGDGGGNRVFGSGPDAEFQSLEKFFDFVRERPDHVWVNWNMTGDPFGFEHLRSRFEQLGGHPPAFPDSLHLFDLKECLQQVYGVDFVPHPRLEQAAIANGLTMTDWLDPKAAREAFERGDWNALRLSVIRKSHVIGDLFTLAANGKLRVAAPGEAFASTNGAEGSDSGVKPTSAVQPAEELRTQYQDPDNYWRNVWLYEQRKAGVTNTAILAELARRANEFAPLESENGLRMAIKSIAQFHGWPHFEGKPGRPSARTKTAKSRSAV